MKKKTTLDKTQDSLLSDEQNDILVGLLLGDAHLRTQNKGRTANLMYSQGGSGAIGEAHLKYLFRVYQLFKDWCTSPPREIVRKSNFEGAIHKTYKSHRFQTVGHASFSILWDTFYKLSPKTFKNNSLLLKELDKTTLKGKIKQDLSLCVPQDVFYRKTVPLNIGEMLSKRALTFWYMDDGSIKDRNSGACLLNTQSFTLDECVLLCDALKNNFGLDAQIRYKNKLHNLFGHQIYISTKSAKILSCFTDDYLEEMRYKLPKQTRAHRFNKL